MALHMNRIYIRVRVTGDLHCSTWLDYSACSSDSCAIGARYQIVYVALIAKIRGLCLQISRIDARSRTWDFSASDWLTDAPAELLLINLG